MVPASSAKVPRVSVYSGSRRARLPYAYGALTLSGRLSQSRSARQHGPLLRSEPRGACAPVWPPPRSLAATWGIDVSFFSSGYLDVSVRRVPLRALCVGARIHGLPPMWVPPFRHLRIVRYLPLPAAFRSLSRLSSALSAKASALCPFCLTCRGARHAASCLRHAWAMPMPSFPSRPLPSFFAFHQIRSLFLSVWIFQGAAHLRYVPAATCSPMPSPA